MAAKKKVSSKKKVSVPKGKPRVGDKPRRYARSPQAQRLRQMRQDALREQLSAKGILNNIQKNFDLLCELDEQIQNAKGNRQKIIQEVRKLVEQGVKEGLSASVVKKQVAELFIEDRNTIEETLAKVDLRHKITKTKLDTEFRRLNKVLPDLKAVELSDPDGNNPFSHFCELMIQATKENTPK